MASSFPDALGRTFFQFDVFGTFIGHSISFQVEQSLSNLSSTVALFRFLALENNDSRAPLKAALPGQIFQ
jgi:hypothetical protein